VLRAMDGRAETYFRNTRTSNPDLYLEQLRASRGFAAFLPEYAALKKFEDFTPHTPEFLIGRWTMRSEQIRLAQGETPSQCSDPITFDFGIVLMVEPQSTTLPVSYRIAEGQVDLRIVQGETLAITPVAIGASIDHLEFVPPGRTDTVYAYFCGG